MIKLKIDKNTNFYHLFIEYIIYFEKNKINFYKYQCSNCNFKMNVVDRNSLRYYNITCFKCCHVIIIEDSCKIHHLHTIPDYGYPRVFYLLIKRVLKLQPNVRWMYIESNIKDD